MDGDAFGEELERVVGARRRRRGLRQLGSSLISLGLAVVAGFFYLSDAFEVRGRVRAVLGERGIEETEAALWLTSAGVVLFVLSRRVVRVAISALLKISVVAGLGAYAVLTFVHYSNGFEMSRSLSLPVQDARMAVSCYERPERVWEFVNRKPGHDVGFQQDLDAGIDIYSSVCTDVAGGPSGGFPSDPAITPVVGIQGDVPVAPVGSPPTLFEPTAPERTPTSLRDDPIDPLRLFMLDLINEDRLLAGLDPVVLGTNAAAQRHADDMLAGDYISHWDLAGLKPYMRYTQEGGEDYEAENAYLACFVSGSALGRDLEADVTVSQEGLMDSPGHRRNILNPSHTHVNIGVAFDEKAFALVQQFEGDYVDFVLAPTIVDGALVMSGWLKDAARLTQIQIWWEPPPSPVTRSQLFATKSYALGAGGRPAAFVVAPAPAGTRYRSTVSTYSFQRPADPHQFERGDSEPPACPSFQPVDQVQRLTVEVPWVIASRWATTGGGFDIRADISDVLAAYGSGVYTVALWAESPDGEPLPVTNFSLFR